MRSRRALSTVVGAIFFVIAASTTIVYVAYSMNAIEDFAQSVIVAESQNIDRGNEKIEFSTVSIDGGKFNATILNTGPISAHLVRLWVVNDDLSPPKNEKGNLDVVINSGSYETNIGQSLGITADPSVSYTLKAVTKRGNIATFKISNDVSTNVKLLVPGSTINNQILTVTLLVWNNSTVPTNIVDLEPTLSSNVTLTQVGTNQSNVKTLKTGEMATFSWQYQAPTNSVGVSFNGSYVGAPTGAFHIANSTIYDITESETALNSQWSEKARKVGILISGIPSPIDGTNNQGLGKFGVGIINPLNRQVEIYAIAINTITKSVFDEVPTGVEPSSTGEWGYEAETGHSLFYWQAGTDPPLVVVPQSVTQFRAITDVSGGALKLREQPVMIQALTSEGKMTVTYQIGVQSSYPTINVYYTTDPTDPIGSGNANWGYEISGVVSNKWKMFNATVENTSNNILTAGNARVAMTILIPKDFTINQVITKDSTPVDNDDWNDAEILVNPDGSSFIKVNSTANITDGYPDPSHKTLQFNLTAPVVTEDSLYVFQTTTYYLNWDAGPQITSSLSEAGVEVIPPP